MHGETSKVWKHKTGGVNGRRFMPNSRRACRNLGSDSVSYFKQSQGHRYIVKTRKLGSAWTQTKRHQTSFFHLQTTAPKAKVEQKGFFGWNIETAKSGSSIIDQSAKHFGVRIQQPNWIFIAQCYSDMLGVVYFSLTKPSLQDVYRLNWAEHWSSSVPNTQKDSEYKKWFYCSATCCKNCQGNTGGV